MSWLCRQVELQPHSITSHSIYSSPCDLLLDLQWFYLVCLFKMLHNQSKHHLRPSVWCWGWCPDNKIWCSSECDWLSCKLLHGQLNWVQIDIQQNICCKSVCHLFMKSFSWMISQSALQCVQVAVVTLLLSCNVIVKLLSWILCITTFVVFPFVTP